MTPSGRPVCRWLLLLSALVVLGGCLSSPAQRELSGVPAAPELTAVPFFPQDDYQCGPAALATVLAHSGVEITPQQLTPRLYVPDRLGSLQAELIAATRSHGRVPWLLPRSSVALLDAVRAGTPVLLLQNLGFERWPIWHYAVLIGFDAQTGTFLLRSGTRARHELAARRFLPSWERADRWAMVAVAPSDPPADADARGWLRAVAPFESTGELALAAQGYAAGVARWPQDPFVWTALGNVRYLQQDLTAAQQAYERSLALAPEHWVARNNLVTTFIVRGCPELARPWTEGVAAPPESFAPTWARTLQGLAALAALATVDADRCTAPR